MTRNACWIAALFCFWAFSGDRPALDLQGPYFGQQPPGQKASLFGEGFISTGLYERDFAMTPDGKEIYFTIMGGTLSVICCTKRVGDQWAKPEVASFSAAENSFDAEPHVTPDGKKLMFLSTRPPEGHEPTPGWSGHQNIWVVDRTESGWGEPYLIGAPISSDDPEYFPSATRDGTLYYTKGKKGSMETALWRSRLVDGSYARPGPLPKQVNAGQTQYNACIAPDESYLLFCAPENDVDGAQPRYFVCFRSPKDVWSHRLMLGEEINLPGGQAISISISPDGKYVFFSSNVANEKYQKKAQSYDLLHLAMTEPRNGYSDIYWVDASAVTDLKSLAIWPKDN